MPKKKKSPIPVGEGSGVSRKRSEKLQSRGWYGDPKDGREMLYPPKKDSKPKAAKPHGSNPSTSESSLTKAQKKSERQAIKADRKSVRDQARKISDKTGEKRTTYIKKSDTGYNLNNKAARALDSKPSMQKPHGAVPKTTHKPSPPLAKKIIKTVKKRSKYF